MQEIRIGVVGTGFIGMRHIDAIRRLNGTRIVAVADTFLPKAQECAKALGNGVQAFTDIETLLEKTEVDVIHNCTPTSMHFPVSKAAIEQGKHLYCEKPLALTVEEGERLLALLQSHPVFNAVNLSYRMNGIVQELRDRVHCSEAGRMLMVTGSYTQDWMLKQDDYDWRLDPELGGASRAIADIGSHLFDASQFVLGQKIVAVNASTMIAYTKRSRYAQCGGTFDKTKCEHVDEIDVCNEDAAVVTARFENGVLGQFQVSQVAAGHKNDMRLRFDLTDLSYEWRQEDGDRLYIGRRDEPNQVMYRELHELGDAARKCSIMPAGHTEGWNDVLLHAISQFYDSIRDGSNTQSTAYATVADGLWLMKIIQACLRSAQSGAWVQVDA